MYAQCKFHKRSLAKNTKQNTVIYRKNQKLNVNTVAMHIPQTGWVALPTKRQKDQKGLCGTTHSKRTRENRCSIHILRSLMAVFFSDNNKTSQTNKQQQQPKEINLF